MFEEIIHRAVLSGPLDHNVALTKPLNEQAPVVFCCSLRCQFLVPVLPEMGHSHRLKKQGVTIVTDRHRFIVAVAGAHPIIREQRAIGP